MFFFRRNPKKRSLPENLAKLQYAEDPAWVWDPDYAIIVWANDRGLKFWDVETVAELRELFFADTHPLTIAGAEAAAQLTEVSEVKEYLFLNPFAVTVGYKYSMQTQSLPDGRKGLLMVGDLKDFRSASEVALDREAAFNLAEKEAVEDFPTLDEKRDFPEALELERDSDLEKLSSQLDSPKDLLNERFGGAGGAKEKVASLKAAIKADTPNFNPPFSYHPSEKNSKFYAEAYRKRTQSGAVFNGDKFSSENKKFNGPQEERPKNIAEFEAVQDKDELAPLPVIEIDSAGEVIYANASARKTFTLAVGNHFAGLFEDVAKGRLTSVAMFASDRIDEVYELSQAGGAKARYQANGFKINDHIVRLFLTPVSEVKKSGVALDPENGEDASSLLSAMSAVGAALFTLDSSGEIVSVSAAAKKITGLFPEDMIGKSFRALFDSQEQDRIDMMLKTPEQWKEAFEEGINVRFVGVQGKICDGALLLREQENGFRAALYDESPLEEMRREIDTLKDRMQAPVSADEGGFTAVSAIPPIVATVSHEIRAPLNAVTGYAEMIESEIFGSLGDPRYKEFAKQIGVAGRYMSEIIGDLLDLSKVNSGEFAPDYKPTDLNQLVDEAVAALYPAALKKDVEIQGTVLSGTPMLKADPRLLKQAMINLLSNAVNYSPEGEQVYIAAGPTKTGRVMIEITDFGGGMTKEELEKAMQPFARGNESDGKGTGLGLPLAKRLTEIQGARFSIDSVPGEKTRARIVFPESSLVQEEAQDFNEEGKTPFEFPA